MSDLEYDRRLWLRVVIALLLSIVIGGLVAHHISGLITGVLSEEMAAAKHDRSLLPVNAKAVTRELVQLAPRPELARIWLWSAIGVSSLLILLFPLLFNPRLFSRPSRWWQGALRYILHVLAFAGIGFLHEPLSSGGPYERSIVLGLIMAALYLLISPRGFGLSIQRIRLVKQIGRRELAKVALYGFAAGTAISAVMVHVDFEFLIKARLYEAVQWAVHFESPRIVPAMQGVLRSLEAGFALGGAAILGSLVALAPTRARLWDRVLAVTLAALPALGLVLHERVAPYEFQQRIFHHNRCATSIYCSIQATYPQDLKASAIWPGPDKPFVLHYPLEEHAFDGILITEENQRRLEAYYKKNAHREPRDLVQVLGLRWRMALRLLQPERALFALLDDAEKTNSILATVMAINQAMSMPPSAQTRRALERLQEGKMFVATPLALEQLADKVVRFEDWSRELRRAAKAGKRALPRLPERWHGGQLGGCVKGPSTLDLTRARVGLFRVSPPFESDSKGPRGILAAAAPLDARGCYSFGGLLPGQYAVGLVWLTSALNKYELSGTLGPILITETQPEVQLGVLTLAQEEPSMACPDGQVKRDGGCKRGCPKDRVISKGHCCWPGQVWEEPTRQCTGKPQCPAGTTLFGDVSCTPKLAPISPVAASGWAEQGDVASETKSQGSSPGQGQGQDLGSGPSQSSGKGLGNGNDPCPMVVIPKGAFLRGAAEGAFGDDIPQREIFLSAFAMDRGEVTVGQYRRCVSSKHCDVHRTSRLKQPEEIDTEAFEECNWDRQGREDHPMNCVTLRQAWDYCQWTGKRLPSEAEWEKAARGTGQQKYPWGDEAPSCKRAVFYKGKQLIDLSLGGAPPMPMDQDYCHQGTVPAARFDQTASPYGARQMAGNVAEWVADWYASNYYEASPEQDPKGPPRLLDVQGKGMGKAVVRGGSWASDPAFLRVTTRAAYDPILIHSTIGFRCAVSLPASE